MSGKDKSYTPNYHKQFVNTEKVALTLEDDQLESITELADIVVVDFPTTDLSKEQYWTDMFNSQVTPDFIGQNASGTTDLGVIVMCIGVAGGFIRSYSDPIIKSGSTYGSAVIAQLQSSSGWDANGEKVISVNVNGQNGDLGMEYKWAGTDYAYYCKGRSGNSSTWKRVIEIDDVVEISDPDSTTREMNFFNTDDVLMSYHPAPETINAVQAQGVALGDIEYSLNGTSWNTVSTPLNITQNYVYWRIIEFIGNPIAVVYLEGKVN